MGGKISCDRADHQTPTLQSLEFTLNTAHPSPLSEISPSSNMIKYIFVAIKARNILKKSPRILSCAFKLYTYIYT